MPEWNRQAAGLFHRLMLALLLLGGILPLSPVHADEPGIREYFIREPVFDARVRMLEAGESKSPLLVLVHGLNASADVWRPFIPSLAQHFHVIAFDLPGFGQSSKANKLYSPDNYVAFMHFVANKFQADRIMLVGHSLGGNIALRYAATYPQQVRRLVLIDAAGVLHRLVYTEFLAHFGIRALPALYPEQHRDLNLLARKLFGILVDYSPVMDIGEQYMLSRADLRQRFLGGYPPAIAAHAMVLTDFSNILDRFSVPTLLLWGGQDHVAPLRTGHLLAANFDNAGLIVFPGAGHNPLLDRTTELRQWLLRFTTGTPVQRDALLAKHRYRLPVRTDTLPDRIGRCRYRHHQVFQGDYRQIVIDHCSDVQLQGVRARQVTIINSKVSISRCRFSSDRATLRVKQSAVSMTACQIEGNPAIQTASSQLDIAGCHLKSGHDVTIADMTGTTSTVLFSVSALISQAHQQYEHGPVQFAAGQGL